LSKFRIPTLKRAPQYWRPWAMARGTRNWKAD